MATVRVTDEATAVAARAVDPDVRVELDPALAEAAPVEAEALAALSDPATRAVASGALLALRVLRAALATEAS